MNPVRGRGHNEIRRDKNVMKKGRKNNTTSIILGTVIAPCPVRSMGKKSDYSLEVLLSFNIRASNGACL